MLVAQRQTKNDQFEVHQVSASGFELRKNGKVIRERRNERHNENHQGIMFDLQNEVERQNEVDNMLNWWQDA